MIPNILFLLLATHSFGQSSFTEIKSQLYASPLKTLPEHPGLSPSDIIKNFVDNVSKPTQGLAIRSRQTFVDKSDYRKPEPKWLHPRGACAEARWIIDEDSQATGLFAKGTNIPAVLRISSGDGTSEYKSDKNFGGRIMGMAIKLFPTKHNDKQVETTNIIALDQYGFERSKRKLLFENDNSSEGPIYFTNVAPAKSILGKILSSFFDRFDAPNWARPVYATAKAQVDGGELQKWMTPYELRFKPNRTNIKSGAIFKDFREELLDTNNLALDIVIQSFDSKNIIEKKIGQLKVGKFVVSDFCDLNLHFHHSAIEDQWEKYQNYDVVKDIY